MLMQGFCQEDTGLVRATALNPGSSNLLLFFNDNKAHSEDILSFVEQDLFGEWIILVKGANDGRPMFLQDLLLPPSIPSAARSPLMK
jgi:hypothetical protein